jgi:hypothetical protein
MQGRRRTADRRWTTQQHHQKNTKKNRPDAKVRLSADLGRYTTIPTSDSTRVCLGIVGNVPGMTIPRHGSNLQCITRLPTMGVPAPFLLRWVFPVHQVRRLLGSPSGAVSGPPVTARHGITMRPKHAPDTCDGNVMSARYRHSSLIGAQPAMAFCHMRMA